MIKVSAIACIMYAAIGAASAQNTQILSATASSCPEITAIAAGNDMQSTMLEIEAKGWLDGSLSASTVADMRNGKIGVLAGHSGNGKAYSDGAWAWIVAWCARSPGADFVDGVDAYIAAAKATRQ